MRLVVSIAEQSAKLMNGEELVRAYPVSTGLAAPSEQRGSGGTPRGRHVIKAKIGARHPLGAVFVGRRPTGEVWPHSLRNDAANRDWILTRILWLGGLEPGRNRGGAVDTLRRFIYLHGCGDEAALGTPVSHGCIRMSNADIIDLFDRVSVGTEVLIMESVMS
jgi:lipoprotein-anchoring transpeptidase ErfK/SrfK